MTTDPTAAAAGPWLSTKNTSPMPRRQYLVASELAGPVMDVAFFEGPRPEGGLWWIMSDCSIPSTSITHFASINNPLA